MSLTRDMSGACSTRSVRFLNRSKAGSEDEAGRAAARTETDEVRSCAGALAASGAEPDGGCRDHGGDRADVPAVVPALRGGGRRRSVGPTIGQAVAEARAGGLGAPGRAALSRALRRLQRQAFLRAPGEGPSLSVQLQLGQELSAPPPAGGDGAAQS